MGRTVPTYRMHLESILSRWQDYRRALREEDRALFDKVVNGARQHASAGGGPQPITTSVGHSSGRSPLERCK